MTATVATTTTTTTTTARHRSHPLLKATVLGGIVAAVTAMALAAVAHAAGVPLAVDGQEIPLLGFAEMTLVGAVLGGLVVAALNRWSGRARQRFQSIAVALTAVVVRPVRGPAARHRHQAGPGCDPPRRSGHRRPGPRPPRTAS